MKKKGFTLIELLAAIIVLGIVSLVVFPTVDRTIKNQKKKLYERQISTIIDAGKAFAVKKTDLLPSPKESEQTSFTNAVASGISTQVSKYEFSSDVVYAGVSALAASGFIENDDIKNPKDSEKINGCVTIKYSYKNNQYVYDFIDLSDTTDGKCDTENICVYVDGTPNCSCTKSNSTNIITCN